MWNEEVEREWRRLSEVVILEVKEWRLRHPKASFKEIEQAVDGSLAKARARLLQDAALTSDTAKVNSDRRGDAGECPQCAHSLVSRGQQTRGLATNYNQSISLKRSYGFCPACGAGLFPPG